MTQSPFALTFPCTTEALWTYTLRGLTISITPPVLELDGISVCCLPESMRQVSVTPLRCGTETLYEGHDTDNGLTLHMLVRHSESPVLRYCYRFYADETRRMTGCALQYGHITLPEQSAVNEIGFSEFYENIHSFQLSERQIPDRFFNGSMQCMGPIVQWENTQGSALWAYEHGSQVPDAFAAFALTPDHGMTLQAVKGNYIPGQDIGEKYYETIWFQLAAACDTATLRDDYRNFVLRYQTQNTASREPYIFYNTWCFQERNKWHNGAQYLDSMNDERILAEIDVAHRMGVDVFVMDTGWYEKTGDWKVNQRRFPQNLKAIRERLGLYGMRLGLWFDPQAAAVSSRLLTEHRDCVQEWQGVESGTREIWETEESHRMCLVSNYADAFAEELIRLNRELGVTYFKWDAITQYGCDAAHHHHGDTQNTQRERADCYAFEVGRAMNRIVDRLCEAVPEAIVDFDITEGWRFVGLSFLSAGKYFLINNGPYYHNLDIPDPKNDWINVYTRPGAARGWVCRAPLKLDSWIPSVLFLTHYLPDNPENSQWINIASAILGQNGIWGDLLALSNEGVQRWGDALALYKKVKYDVTEAAPVRFGVVGGSPEIYEKVNADGRGVIVAFASDGFYDYISEHVVDRRCWCSPHVKVEFDMAGRAVLRFDFTQTGAVIVFFGAE